MCFLINKVMILNYNTSSLMDMSGGDFLMDKGLNLHFVGVQASILKGIILGGILMCILMCLLRYLVVFNVLDDDEVVFDVISS